MKRGLVVALFCLALSCGRETEGTEHADVVSEKHQDLTVTWSSMGGVPGQHLASLGAAVANNIDANWGHTTWLYQPLTNNLMETADTGSNSWNSTLAFATPSKSPAVVVSIDSHHCQTLFFRDSSNHISRIFESWNGSNCALGGSAAAISSTTIASAPAATAWNDGSCKPPPCISRPQRYDVLAVDTSGNIVQNTFSGASQTSGTWTGWSTVSGGVAASGTDVAAISRTPGTIQAFAIGTDGNLYWNGFDGTWAGWTSLGKPTTSIANGPVASSVQVSTTTFSVYVLGSDGKIWFRTTTDSGSTFSAWDSCGTKTFSSGVKPAASNFQSIGGIVLNRIYAQPGDGALWTATCP